MAINSPLFL